MIGLNVTVLLQVEGQTAYMVFDSCFRTGLVQTTHGQSALTKYEYGARKFNSKSLSGWVGIAL